MEKGTILIATNPCVMQFSGKATLTVGKEYVVTDLSCKQVSVVDDDGEVHSFDKRGDDSWEQFFKIKIVADKNKQPALPCKDEAVGKGFNNAITAGYTARRVITDEEDDLYFTGWMDCYDWMTKK